MKKLQPIYHIRSCCQSAVIYGTLVTCFGNCYGSHYPCRPVVPAEVRSADNISGVVFGQCYWSLFPPRSASSIESTKILMGLITHVCLSFHPTSAPPITSPG